MLLDRKPDILDINLGCSVKAISARGAGAGMLRDLNNVHALISTLTKELSIPIITKIRLGWDENTKQPVEIAKMLEDAGSRLITVHARTRSQHFQHNADWSAISEVKKGSGIPVIGNGDVKYPQDINLMKNTTGCDRSDDLAGCHRQSWIFSRVDPSDVSPAEKVSVMKVHYENDVRFLWWLQSIAAFPKTCSWITESFLSLNRNDRQQSCKSTGN